MVSVTRDAVNNIYNVTGRSVFFSHTDCTFIGVASNVSPYLRMTSLMMMTIISRIRINSQQHRETRVSHPLDRPGGRNVRRDLMRALVRAVSLLQSDPCQPRMTTILIRMTVAKEGGLKRSSLTMFMGKVRPLPPLILKQQLPT